MKKQKSSADRVSGMGLPEILAAILGEEDVSGVTVILPGQPVTHIMKGEETNEKGR